MSNLSMVTREQALAFRLNNHHLDRRLPAADLIAAAGACGVQNTPPGAAELALHARLEGLPPGLVERGLEEEKRLYQAWCLRAAPHIFPTSESAVFTRGLLPEEEESLRGYLFGAIQGLKQCEMQAVRLVELTEQGLEAVLAGQALTKDELGREISSRAEAQLIPRQREAWLSPSPYAAGQSLGESLVRFALPVMALQGRICHAERRGNQAYLRLAREWLPSAPPEQSPEQARRELVRRYLACYGPSTPGGFAAWAGIAAVQAERSWNLAAGELHPVSLDGRDAWLLERDLPRLFDPPAAQGVRFLPPHDPFLQQRDRETLVPERAVQRLIWRTAGIPGLVLVDGRPAAIWRARKQGRRLEVTVEWLAEVRKGWKDRVEAEAAGLAAYKGCEAVQVRFGEAG